MANVGVSILSTKSDPLPVVHKTHGVQLYSDDAHLLDVLGRFIGDALTNGNAAIVIATESHLRQVEKRLSALGMAPSKAAKQGRYIPLEARKFWPRLRFRVRSTRHVSIPSSAMC